MNLRNYILLLISSGLLSSAANATTYYVSPTGSDSNNGTSTGTPWKTITKVNGIAFAPGDTVLFQGGQSFSGSLNFDANDSATAASPFTISSYGTGHAIINGGTGIGLYAYNCAGLVISTLDIVGSGAGTNTNDGINLYGDLAGNMKLNYIRIDHVNVSGFGRRGIVIGTWSNLTGYQDVRVTNTTSHDNKQDGMAVYAQVKNANVNFYVGYCQFYNNTGIAGSANPTGSGVTLAQVDGGTIERSIAHHNGASNTNSAGPVGIWTYQSNNVVIQYNESYSNKTAGGDGDGFDLDGGSTNCILQYNYSHDNDGGGFCLFQYAGAGTFSGNTVRYNISQSDGRRNGALGAISIWGASSTDRVTNSNIYNNTIFMSPATGARAIGFQNSNYTNITVRNNILVTTGGVKLIDCPSNGQATFQGNDYWPSGGAFSITWGGVTYSSLSAWRTATGQEKNGAADTGYSVDPLLTSPGNGGTIGNVNLLSSLTNYRLKAASPMINTGLNLPSLFGLNVGTHDFYMNAIPSSGQYDIGANEVSSSVDLNLDGKEDILWFNPVTGANNVWLMNGTTYSSTVALGAVSANWKMVGAADFNSDGKSDILWRNAVTGANTVWLMNGVTWSSSVSLTAVTDLNWKMIGAGDFNSDGKSDILWRNTATGANSIWLMNGTIQSSSVVLGALTDQNWKMIGAGDFNSDGKPDILWRNYSTSANTVWLMNGTTWSSSVALNPTTDLNWKMIRAGDFNSDGKADILWRHATTGANTVWLMNGTTLASGVNLNALTDLNWKMAGGQGNN